MARKKKKDSGYFNDLMLFSKTKFGKILLCIIVVCIIVVCVILEILMFIFPELREIEAAIDKKLGIG